MNLAGTTCATRPAGPARRSRRSGPPGRPEPAALEGLERAERELRVRRAVLHLPHRQREVLTLRIDAELPFAEIAAALGVTENAAKVSFHHAVRRLRALVGEEDRK